ncbi:LysR family transcriptional regulator [Streptomyces buecherae]
MELDVRHLRALCAIADAGSVRKAALQLGMTQPSLTTQLRRIEKAIGGLLFTREQSGSQPTPLGRSILARARPIVADMSALVSAAKDAAANISEAHLRIGSTGNRAVAGWLRRLHTRLPDTDTTIHVDVSATMLLQMVATQQLDVAFVHEFTGFPLPVPSGVERRVLVAREPQFIALSASHPAAERPVVRLADLADDRWVVDLTVEDECAALRRVFADAGLNPRLVHVRDNTTAAELVASGEAVTPCQPTTSAREGIVIRPLRDDPLTVRLFMVSRPHTTCAPDADALYADLKASYLELAWANAAYRLWLLRHNSPLLRSDEATPGARPPSAAASCLAPIPVTLPVPGPAPTSARAAAAPSGWRSPSAAG